MSDVLLERLLDDKVDYLDFGCGAGGSMNYLGKVYSDAFGLGIDIDKSKIANALLAGHNAMAFDITQLPKDKLVKFVMMSHFLEHLSSVRDAQVMINTAVSLAKEFVFVRQPWFDSDSALFNLGLKFYWPHWSAHPNRMTCLCFYQILQKELDNGRIRSYQIYGNTPIVSSDVYSVIPLSAPVNSHHYDLSKHGMKRSVSFSFGAYKEIMVLIDVSGSGSADDLINSFGKMDLIFASDKCV